MGFATHKLAEWPASKKYFERRDSCRRPSLSRTISASHNGAQMQKKKKKADTQTMTFPPLTAGCGLCAFVLCCWLVFWDVGRCVHWMEGHPLCGRAEREGSRTGQLHRASAARAEITVEEESLFPLDQGVSSLTWKSLLEGDHHLSDMVKYCFLRYFSAWFLSLKQFQVGLNVTYIYRC